MKNILVKRLLNNWLICWKNPIHANLSDREYQIMCLIAKGKTISDIAKDLLLSVHTISKFRTRKKMNMKNNAEITYYAIKEGLVN